VTDLFRHDAIERAKRRCRIARGGEKRRRERELRQVIAAALLTEISEDERKRLVGKHRPLRSISSRDITAGGGVAS